MAQEFTSYEVGRALKIPKERLRGWMKEEFIIPATPAEGRGTKSMFTLTDVYGVALFQDLIAWGLNRSDASNFVTEFVRYSVPELIKFLVFRFEPDPRGDLCRSQQIPEGVSELYEFDLKLGIPTSKYHFDPIDSSNDWNRIMLINFKMIRERVDKALADM